MQSKPLILRAMILMIAVFVLAACGSDYDGDTNQPDDVITNTPEISVTAEYQTLSIDEFADIVQNRPDDYQIINVHIPYAGEVENTNANIAYNDLDALTAAISGKDTPVILYCRSGNMSEQASRALVEQGYTQVWDVPGGMVAWQASGRELIDR